MKTKVSIILPIYNIKEEYLIKCIESLLNQTEKNIEIILVDDGSENNSYDVCKRLSLKDNRIILIHQENSGVSVARNKGIEISTGEYICFVDPDDWVENNYISELLDIIQKTKSDIALCNCFVYYSQNKQIQNKFLNVPSEYILEGDDKNRILYQLLGKKICNYYPPEIAAGVPWAKMFKKQFIEDNNFTFIPEMKRMQDNIFCLYAIEKATKISYTSKFLYYYRKEVGSACYKYDPNIVCKFEQYFDESFIFLNKMGKEQKLKNAMYMKELTSFNSFLLQYYFSNQNKKKYSEIKKEICELLNNDRYKKAMNHLDYKLLNSQEKIFVFALKKRLILMLLFLIKVRNLFKM